MARRRQSEFEEMDDAVIVEGGGEAFEKVKILLEKVRKSHENEDSTVDIVLAQHSKEKDGQDVVETFEFGLDTPIDDIAMAIVDRAEEDCSGMESKRGVKYSVRAEGLKARCLFTLKYDDGDEEDMDDIDDVPNRKGLMGLLMRHQEGIYKLSVGEAKHMIDALTTQVREKDKTIADMQRSSIENLKVYEELLSGKHIRDLELRKVENKERRMDQLAGTVLQGFPLLVGKFLGGGAGAVAMQQAPGARSQMETLVEGFIKTLDSEQFNKIVNSGLFNPMQIAGLVEIVKFIMEREEEENKRSAAAGSDASSGQRQAHASQQANGANDPQSPPASP